MALIRVPSMILRLAWVINLVLGIGFWSSHFTNLVGLHMTLGILVVLSLFWIAILFIRQNGLGVLPVLGFLDGLALYAVGVSQTQSITPGIQVLHLALGVAAIALAEIMAARLTRQTSAAAR